MYYAVTLLLSCFWQELCMRQNERLLLHINSDFKPLHITTMNGYFAPRSINMNLGKMINIYFNLGKIISCVLCNVIHMSGLTKIVKFELIRIFGGMLGL